MLLVNRDGSAVLAKGWGLPSSTQIRPLRAPGGLSSRALEHR